MLSAIRGSRSSKAREQIPAVSTWNRRSATAGAMAAARWIRRSVVAQAQRTRPGRASRPRPRGSAASSAGAADDRRRRQRSADGLGAWRVADEAGELPFRSLPSGRLDGHLTASRGCGGSSWPCDPREFVEDVPVLLPALPGQWGAVAPERHRLHARQSHAPAAAAARHPELTLTSLQQRLFQRAAGTSAECAVL